MPIKVLNNRLFQKKVYLSSKIGILMKRPESNFSNGCVQQGVFLKQLLENIGFSCEYISIEKQYKKIHDLGDEVVFMDETTDLSEYRTFIFVSLTLTSPDNSSIIDNIKRHGIVCINLICGNLFILHQEEFVFGHHKIMEKFINTPLYDEHWILEMYPFLTEYIQLMTNKPTYLLPYVWNNTILTKFIQSHKLPLEIDYHDVNREKINILIFEPNMSIHKTCLIPLLIAEDYNKKYGDKLNKIYVFCGDNVIKKNNPGFIKSLSMYTQKKIETYGRVAMPSIIALIRRSNSFINVVLSHNILNSLNFLHLELLHMDIPFIHNCKPFSDNGLYYDDHSLSSAVNMIDFVRTNFFTNSKYITNKYKIHKEFHPSNYERQQVYKSHIERVTGIEVDTNKKLGPAKKIIDIFAKVIKFIKTKEVESSLFYNGTGLIMLVQHLEQIHFAKKTLNNLNSCDNKLNVEIVYHGDVIDIRDLYGIVEGYTVDFLDISTEFDNLEDRPNMFMTIVFSRFNKGICIEPGTLFVNTPENIWKEYSTEDYNSISCYPSYTRVKHMTSLDQDVHYELAKFITPFPISTMDFLSDNKILFFNKTDDNCRKVLGTMCELYKINTYMANNINVLGLVCEANYNNDKSILKTNQELLGQMDSSFKGLAIYHNTDIILAYNEFVKDQTTSNVMINISNNDVEIKYDKFFSFKGKSNGKKIPKHIVKIL